MSKDPLELKQYIRTVEDFPIDGIIFRDITSLIENPEGLIKSCNAFTELTKEFGATIIASIESRGFIFAGPISKDLSLPFVLARKPGKLPNKTYKKEETSIAICKDSVLHKKGVGAYRFKCKKTPRFLNKKKTKKKLYKYRK